MFLNGSINVSQVSTENIQSILNNSTMDEIEDFIIELQQIDSAYPFNDPRRQYARSLMPYAVEKMTQMRRLWDAAVQAHHVSYAQAKADPAIRMEFDPVAATRMLDPRYSTQQKAQDIQTAQELHIEGADATAQPLYIAQHETVAQIKPSPASVNPAYAPTVKPASIPTISNTEVHPVFQAGYVAPAVGSEVPPGAQSLLPASDGGSGGSGLLKIGLLAALAYLGM